MFSLRVSWQIINDSKDQNDEVNFHSSATISRWLSELMQQQAKLKVEMAGLV